LPPLETASTLKGLDRPMKPATERAVGSSPGSVQEKEELGREGGEAANFVTGEATESGKERRLGGEKGEVGASSAGTGSIGEALPGWRGRGEVEGVKGWESAFGRAAGVAEESFLRMKMIVYD
jgi:hypothetical protein